MEGDFPILINLEAGADRAYMEAIRKKLIAFNEGATGKENHAELFFSARSAGGELVGGLIAAIYWHTLHVDVIWTEVGYRGKGIASRLLREAEKEALAKGCKLAILETFDFQAPAFYLKQGYVQVGQIDDYPKGHTKFIFRKAL